MFRLFFPSHEKSATATERIPFQDEKSLRSKTPTKSFGDRYWAWQQQRLAFLAFFLLFSASLPNRSGMMENAMVITSHGCKRHSLLFQKEFFFRMREMSCFWTVCGDRLSLT